MTKKTSNIYKTFDIVIVPFPFVDDFNSKKRPAIVISSTNFNSQSEHTVLAMITSAKHYQWPLDVPIIDLDATGLTKPSIIRFKLFTLDNRFIYAKIGMLAKKEQIVCKKNMRLLFADSI